MLSALLCPGCGQKGTARWRIECDKPALLNEVSEGFHIETNRPGAAARIAVCNTCDYIQPDPPA